MLAGEGVGVQHDGCAAFHGLGIHAALAAVGIKGDGDLFDLAVLHPHVLVSVIDIGVACSGGRGIGVGMSRTAVFQEGRVDRDGVIDRCSVVLCSLIGVLFGACTIDYFDLAGFVRRDDAGPSRGGKQEAIGSNRTVDIKNHICQISLCTVIGTTRRIAQGDEAVVAMDIFHIVHTIQICVITIGPLVCVVDKQIIPFTGFNGAAGLIGISNVQRCALGNTQG